MPDTETLRAGVANLLMSLSNADLKGMGAGKNAMVGMAVAGVGNWVGGKYRLTRHAIHFEMNPLNKAFQTDTRAVFIPLASITNIARGRMLLFFPTADITSATGLYRFRMAPGKTLPFLAALRQILGG